jgi:hypothetical protein
MPALNPNHPVTQAMNDHWHKVTALVMQKLGVRHMVISGADLAAMPADMFMVVQELSDGIHVRFVDEATARRLARENGGLPT